MSSARPKLALDTPKVVTAWDTESGRVVYLTAGRTWSSDLGEAHVLTGAAGEEALAFALGDETRATDPYVMQVSTAGAVDGRETIRERIRERGPTNHPFFGKQAGNP
jgi:hypothetical protein